MVKSVFSTTWKRSVQRRKQRKYLYNSPLHLKQKQVHVHLSKSLRDKHGLRNIQVKKGDKIKVLRGQHKNKEGKVDRVNLKSGKVYVSGIEYIKKEGARMPVALTSSNLMVVDLVAGDKKRKQKLNNKDNSKNQNNKDKIKNKETQAAEAVL